MKRNHGIIGPSQANTITGTQYESSASGVFDLHDQNLVITSRGNWPVTKKVTKVFVSSDASGGAINEGAVLGVAVYGGGTIDNYGGASGWATSDVLYYTIATTSGTTLVDADLVGGSGLLDTIEGSFSFAADGDASISLSIKFKAEYPGVTENNKCKFKVYRDSGRTDLLNESNEITINDVTGAANKDVYFTLRENRYGTNIGTISHYLTDTSGNIIHTFGTTSGNYGNATWLFKSWASNPDSLTPGTQFHMAWLHQAGGSFRGDYAIDEVKLYIDGSNVETWGFESTSDGVGTGGYSGISGWRHANQTNTSSSTTAFNVNSALAITSNHPTGFGIWSCDGGGTTSSSTGPNIAYQGTYYCYTETTSRFSGYHWLFSEVLTVP